MILYATSPWYLYIARFISGFSGSLALVAIPFLVAEIAENHIRGALASILTVATNAGVLIGFIVGNYFDYNTVPKILIAFPIAFVGCYYFFPESPWYLVQCNSLDAAEKSLRFYRNANRNVEQKSEEIFQMEFIKLKDSYLTSMKSECCTNGAQMITLKDFGKFFKLTLQPFLFWINLNYIRL